MTRNFKALGFALLAAFVLSAAAVSAASADLFERINYPNTVLTGSSETDQIFSIPGIGLESVCSRAEFSGTIITTTTTSATLFPTYKGKTGEPNNPDCNVKPLGDATVGFNGCDFKFTSTTDAKHNGVSNTHAQVHVECPTGKHIEIIAPGCTIVIPGHTPTEGGVKYTNIKHNSIDSLTINATVTGITFTSSGFLCSTFGIPAEADNARYTGKGAVTGYEDLCAAGECPFEVDKFKEGNQVGIKLNVT